MGESSADSLSHRIQKYYLDKTAGLQEDEQEKDGKKRKTSRWERSRDTNWEHSGASLKGWMNQVVGGLDLPFKSIAMFAGCWMMLEIGWPLLILFGVATAGTVWSIPTVIPCMYIGVYILIMTSGMNSVRSIILQLGSRRDNLVKALFRGYFWSLLSIGLILLIHEYFHTVMPQLFFLPLFYLLPVQILGNTTPIPIPLGFSGQYMDIAVTIIVYAVGITGSSIGGIELLQHLLDNSQQRGIYGSIFGLLLLAIFPIANIYFSLVFLNTTLDLFGRCVTFG